MPTVSLRTIVVFVMAACFVSVGMLLAAHGIGAAVAKLAASCGFILLAIKAGSLQSRYGRVVLLGLSFSWLGDALLVGRTEAIFLLGLGAFLFAHISYITAFIVRGTNLKWAASAAVVIVPVAVAVSWWLTPSVSQELLFPVRAYTTVISLMVIAAFATHGKEASRLIVAGAVLFFLSDLSVANLRLLQNESATYVWGLPAYYAAQVCLAVSTSQSRSHGGTPEKRSARKSISARTR